MATAHFQPPLRMTHLLEGDLQRAPLAFWSVLVASETSDPDGLLTQAASLAMTFGRPLSKHSVVVGLIFWGILGDHNLTAQGCLLDIGVAMNKSLLSEVIRASPEET